MGSASLDVSLRRIARLAKGWVPLGQAGEQLTPALARLRRYLTEAGRRSPVPRVHGQAGVFEQPAGGGQRRD